ncbi:MAG: hypothetical protein FD126_1632 [Elusimicrobia bacterium]|nr:MAG: hypothetical protein FD126_1632 [Elusimicrobiota bacterium]
MKFAVPPDWRTNLPRSLAVGLWGGAVLGSAFVIWNAGRYRSILPAAREWAMLDAMVACGIAAPLGWAFWAGFIIKPEIPAGGPSAT